MPSARGASVDSQVVSIQPLRTETILVTVVGTRPLICNRMSEKSRGQILLGGVRKTTADKQGTAKHDVMDEFRASPYILTDDGAPTLIALMSSSFKGAMSTAALDLPGAKRTQIGRLVQIAEDDYLPVYGEPKLLMSVVRSADINRTPDIRTRVILPEWACRVKITYVVPLINQTSIANLMSAAGMTAGVGDWRPEKGKGTYGQFAIVDADHPKFLELQATWGREPQQQAMDDPQPYDSETESMLAWYGGETGRRGLKVAV